MDGEAFLFNVVRDVGALVQFASGLSLRVELGKPEGWQPDLMGRLTEYPYEMQVNIKLSDNGIYRTFKLRSNW